ncbi:MAG: WD40 repeat domain-containing protein, partial [Helicobacter sp.]|nr:WD40 repeat domain-containing protein [Helicobacter sp.]
MAIVELQGDLFRTIQVNGSVLSLQEYDTKLLCVDSTYSLTVFSKELSLEKNTQISKDAEQPHRYSNAYSASPFGLVCVPIMGTKEGVVLRVGDEVKTVGAIDDHEADVESSAFSPDGRYYATGGQDGRIFLYDTQRLSVIGSLIPRSDYISSLRFSHDSELLACAGYDKTVVVFDMVQNKTRCTIKTPDVVEKVAFCDEAQKLFMVLRNGASMLYDLVNRELLSTENLFATWPSSLAVSPDGRFAIVGVRGDSLYIVNALNNSKLMEIKINASGTNRIFFSKDWLFVGTIDGNILVIEYQKGQQELENAVRKKDYKTARAMIENNVFLTIHPLMKVFDDDWPEILQKAIALLNAQKIEEAVKLVQPFVYDQEKSREFDFYLGQQGAVRDFNKCVENKEYSKAYDMTLTVKFLVNTATYATLEQAWNRAFMQAKRLLEDNPSLNLRKAEAALKPFDSGVKREIIGKLLKNHQVFSQAEDLIKHKNF